jgi:L-lactate dehydrogenase complex protein LldF
MRYSPDSFKDNIAEALDNAQLRKNLNKALNHTLCIRQKLINEYGNEWELMREKANKIKAHTIDHLYDYLQLFDVNAKKNGFKIIWAKNTDEACKAVYDIISNKKGGKVVKSKSMTTEEIGLNHFLEKNNIEVVETDLGEYIVQLAGEPPSHVTAPAIHKSKEEIGKLFADKLAIEYSSDPTKLTKIARGILREKFLNADIGISGVNFAIAETGSIVIIENEGNARLSNTAPKTHIAIMGMEKLLPSLEDFDTFIKLLPGSATGQKITSYISMLNSVGISEKKNVPEEVYIVILDNGRSDLLADPKYKSALYCIRCGACMNICPVYQRVGGQSYGWVYPGPIGSVLTPNYLNKKIAKDLPYASSLCGSCAEICPVKIDLHHKLLDLRGDIVRAGYSSGFESLIFKMFKIMMLSLGFYTISSWFGKHLQFLFTGENGYLKIPFYNKSKFYPPIAKQSFHDWWKENNKSDAVK